MRQIDTSFTACVVLPVPPIPPLYILEAFLAVVKIPAIIILRHSGNTPVNQTQNLCLSPQALNIATIYIGNRVRAEASQDQNRLLRRHYPTFKL